MTAIVLLLVVASTPSILILLLECVRNISFSETDGIAYIFDEMTTSDPLETLYCDFISTSTGLSVNETEG